MNRKEYCLEKGGDDQTKNNNNENVFYNKVYVPGRISFPDGLKPGFNTAKGLILIDGVLFVQLFQLSLWLFLFIFFRLAIVL